MKSVYKELIIQAQLRNDRRLKESENFVRGQLSKLGDSSEQLHADICRK